MIEQLERFGVDKNPAFVPQMQGNMWDGESFGAEQYLESGGRWDRETFDGLRAILARKENYPIPVRKVFILQAQGIGISSGIEITPDEEYAFAVSRGKHIEASLCDKGLMREVFLLTGNIPKLRHFESIDSHVHHEVVWQVSDPRPREEVSRIIHRRTEKVIAYNQ